MQILFCSRNFDLTPACMFHVARLFQTTIRLVKMSRLPSKRPSQRLKLLEFKVEISHHSSCVQSPKRPAVIAYGGVCVFLSGSDC